MPVFRVAGVGRCGCLGFWVFKLLLHLVEELLVMAGCFVGCYIRLQACNKLVNFGFESAVYLIAALVLLG